MKNVHLELAQQILQRENLTDETIKKQRLDYLNLLLIDLDNSNQEWVNKCIAGNEGEVISLTYSVSDDDTRGTACNSFDLQPIGQMLNKLMKLLPQV